VRICLVTDRRRLVPPGATDHEARRCLLTQIRHAVHAGVDLIQVRERDLEAAALAALVREVIAAARGTATRVIVNDRLDIALTCGADGVHLRSDSMSVAAARELAPPPFMIGRSIHRIDELTTARGADYLIAGTVFSSASKPGGHPLLGVEGLRAIARAASAPVLAIGGITMERLDAVAAAGASGVAAIGLFMRLGEAAADGCRARALHETVAQARVRFDSVNSPP
jgi:thiamine-phosphate pyrophosphorylase